MKNDFPLSQKYIDFINTVNGVTAEFCEGTTASGKTTVGAGVKFMRMVSRSNKKLHVIASKTVGTAEKNIINSDNGILAIHSNAVYCGNGDKDNKLPHIKFEGKIIYILGYDNIDKWKQALGSQFGAVCIDEINTANIEFVREISTRNDYMLATLNPDNPDLPIYKEFVNRSRPFKKYKDDVPPEILRELKEEEMPTWKYWFFTFYDNLSLSDADIEKKKTSAPKGTKLYKNKILGLRGKATGMVFPNFNRAKHVVDDAWIEEQIKQRKLRWQKFAIGVDTAYSSQSEDTVSIMFLGIDKQGRLFVLEELVINNKNREVPFAPSDVVKKIIEFADSCGRKWGIAREIYIDSSDQATITEASKYKRKNPCIYDFYNSYKNVAIIDRINFVLGWLDKGYYFVTKQCSEHIKELETYSWQENKDIPEDANDHTINATQYGWIPYRQIIGIKGVK